VVLIDQANQRSHSHTAPPRAPTVEEVSDAARRLLGAECAGFLVDADPGTERRGPYAEWLTTRTPEDTIVTFNYDRVIERIAEHEAQNGNPLKVHVVLPKGAAEDSRAYR
jgi:hypothetical protein